MTNQRILVSATVPVDAEKAWHYYTEAEHVINWNFASADWHCPKAVNDLRVGGEFTITMASKDGEMSFDLEGTYDRVERPRLIAYTLKNGREVSVEFAAEGSDATGVAVSFEPEGDNDHEAQREGWQHILDNYVSYVAESAAAH